VVLRRGDGRVALWVLPVGDLAGVGRHALDVARAGIPGWRTVFLAPDGPVVPALRGAGAEVRVARFGPGHGLRDSVGSLRHAVAAVRPAVVHTHLSYADVVAALVKSRGTSLVTTEHGIADDDLVYHRSRLRSQGRARLHQARLHRVDAVIAVSDATLRVARSKWRIPARVRQRVIRNGVDLPARAPLPRRGLHVVSLARLAPEKRLPLLVAGFALLADEHDEARLTLAGTGPLETDLRRQVASLGMGDRVCFPGFVEAGTLLDEAHVLAQLSVWENCSYSLLDAVAHGIGVVASPVGGNREILPQRCLVEPADPEAVAHALANQGLEPSRRPELAAGWPDVHEMTDQVAEVYAEVTR
jgi:glycosyltransferase involved in cell wall biosynthesis